MRPIVTSQPQKPSRRSLLLGAVALGIAAATPVWAQEQPSTKMTATEAHDAALAGDIILVDIRRPDEWEGTGIGEGAIALDMREDEFVPQLIALRQASPDKPIALICRTGNRSQFVVSALAGQGFPGLVDVSEGMEGGRNGTGWVPLGLPIYAGTSVEIASRLEAVMPCENC